MQKNIVWKWICEEFKFCHFIKQQIYETGKFVLKITVFYII